MVTGRRSALIVACADYQDPGLQCLRAPTRDAEALASVLKDPRIGGFDVRTLLNEPAYVVSEAVEEFFADRSTEDLLLLHFSCHGVKDESGELYFAASNTKLTRLGATGVAAEFVSRRMNRSRSRRIVLLLDCCYAGAFERGMTHRADTSMNLQEQLSGRGRAVITASSSMEYSFESGALADAANGGPSVFTGALVDGLSTGEADRNQDGLITLDELYDHVYAKVRAASPNQTPGKWVFGVQGDLHIARRIRRLREPTPLPVELEQLIDNPISRVRMAAVDELQKLRRGRHLGLAESAEQALQKLAKDDSRSVAAAASVALREQIRLPVLPSIPAESTGRAAPNSKPEPAVPTPKPEPAVPTPKPKPEPVRPLPPKSKPAPPATTPPKPVRPVAGLPVVPRLSRPPSAGAPHSVPNARSVRSTPETPVRTTPPPAVERPHHTLERATHEPPKAAEAPSPTPKDALLCRSAAALTVVAALLMAVNPFVPYVRGSDETLLDVGLQVVLPALCTAALVGVTGIVLCGSSRNRLVGAGLLLGLSATLPWFLWNQWEPRSMWGLATWIWYVGLWALVFAAVLVGVAVVRRPEVRLEWPAQLSPRSWIFLSIGASSALVLGTDQFVVGNHPLAPESWGSVIWVLMALVTPICVSAVSSDRFAVALAIGWACAAAITAYYSAYEAHRSGNDIELIFVFGALLVVLVVSAAASSSMRPSDDE